MSHVLRTPAIVGQAQDALAYLNPHGSIVSKSKGCCNLAVKGHRPPWLLGTGVGRLLLPRPCFLRIVPIGLLECILCAQQQLKMD